MPPRDTQPRHTTGTRICKLCWHSTPPAQDMFIVVGMGDDPLLACGRCAEKVLRLSVTGHPLPAEGGEAIDPDQFTFDFITG